MSHSECGRLEPVTASTESSVTLSGNFSIRERLRECLKPQYRLRRINNKGAILVVVWSYLITSLYYYNFYIKSTPGSPKPVNIAILIILGISMPLVGWLADVRFGRYKVISISIWTMWISAMLLTSGQVILQSLSSTNVVLYSKIVQILIVPLGVGYIGFQANIIQFGVDQLYDASSSEIKTFVMWYSWGALSSASIVGTVKDYASDNFKIIASLIICLNLTVAVSLKLIFKGVLIVEPVTKNPFKLVYDVIKYAVKNKHPRLRSAFTYCDDEKPSRIDFGKRKYGGPFTTEQVEDVKTLFRVTIILLIASALIGLTNTERSFGATLRHIFLKQVTHPPHYIYSNFFNIAVLVLIPLNEVIVYPLFYCCLPNLTAFRKFLIGGLLHLTYYLILLTLIIHARYQFIHEDGMLTNATLSCTLHERSNFLSQSLDYKWTILIEIILAMSDMFILVAAIEFYCSQVPYSMKGLLAGAIYGLTTVFAAWSQLLVLLFELNTTSWGTGTLSCEFWYLLTLLLFILAMLTLFPLIMKWYKKRKREDVLPNEHIFAERYYSQE